MATPPLRPKVHSVYRSEKRQVSARSTRSVYGVSEMAH